MKNSIVRLREIEIKNFKNVQYGKISINEKLNCNTTDIVGIYGQNGSGKTAVIESINFLKLMLSGESLPSDSHEYINKNCKYSELSFKLYIQKFEEKFLVEYYFRLEREDNEKISISKESLVYSTYVNESWKEKRVLVEYNKYEEDISFNTKDKYKNLIKSNSKNEIDINVAKKLSIEKNTSFIFSSYMKDMWTQLKENNKSMWGDNFNIINELYNYAKINLYVIMNNHNGYISMNLAIPMVFRMEEKRSISTGSITVKLEGKSMISESYLDMLKKIIEQINKVLGTVIPKLNIGIKEYGTQLNENGVEDIIIELVSKKDNVQIPLRFESEGIKKIISILSIIIFIYNNPSACLVVDEFDSGVYEFLLGEILQILKENGKGQLIFTSHNLRPLEVLDKKELYFTTVNPNQRYIQLISIKTTNNIRDVYLRSINLGGQKETIYEETDSLQIARALRLAGDAIEQY